MNRYINWCLAFAGFCLLGAAMVGIVDWWNCTKHSGGRACAESRTVAIVALTGAATTALGIAVPNRSGQP